MLMPEERAALVDYCQRMEADDLTVGTSGNLSVRVGDHVAITPSGVHYQDLTPELICVIDLDGRVVEAELAPSTEVPMHTAVYAAADAAAVVHSHPIYSTALSITRDEVPPVHYMIMALGGPVRVAPYARFGSRELAQGSVDAMKGRTGVLLRNHGVTTYGDSLDKAYTRLTYLEWVCRLYHHACQIGEPALLTPEQLDDVAQEIGTYGQAVNKEA